MRLALLLLAAWLSNDDAADWNDRGVQLRRQGDYTAAIAAFQKAIAQSPHDARILSNLALAFENAGQRDQAVTLDPTTELFRKNLQCLSSAVHWTPRLNSAA